MTAQVGGDDPVGDGEPGQLVLPLGSPAAEAVQENQRALREVGGDVDDREMHGRHPGEAHFLAVELQVDFHGSGWVNNHGFAPRSMWGGGVV